MATLWSLYMLFNNTGEFELRRLTSKWSLLFVHVVFKYAVYVVYVMQHKMRKRLES